MKFQTIALLGVTLLGSAEADIMIQPGYKQKNHETQVSDESEQTPTTQAPRQANSELAEEFDRYRSLHRAIEGQLVHLIHEQSSQNLQKSAPEVIAVPVNFRPRLIRPLQHRLGGSRSFYLTPAGPYGLYPGDYGYQSHPYRGAEEESSNQQDYAVSRGWISSTAPLSFRGGTTVWIICCRQLGLSGRDRSTEGLDSTVTSSARYKMWPRSRP